MKRFELGSADTVERLAPVERPEPVSMPGHVVVRMRAFSLNFHDYLVATGVLPTEAGRVPLSDGVGEVVDVGAGVTAFKVGDRVMGTFFPDWIDGPATAAKIRRMRGDHADGFAAEFVSVPDTHVTCVPAGMSDVEASTLPCAALTAWRALFVEGALKPGDRVLVEGSGGVSVVSIQLARLAGATVIATTSSAAKAEKLRALGAEVINYVEQPKWGEAALAMTGGIGVDHLLEVAGGNLSQSVRALRIGGRLYIIGALTRKPIELSTLAVVTSNANFTGITVGSREHQEDMVRALEANPIRPVIDRVFPFAELGAAFAYMGSGAQFGKICVAID